MDSTVFDDAVATQDTVTQLVAAIRKVARVVPGAGAVIAAVCTLDYGKPGKPPIDWDDPAAKQALVSDLVNDALAVLEALTGPGAPERDAAAADALGLLALVAGQDVEPAEESDGTDGRWRIARKVAPDRVISTVDTQARHTRKCKSKRRDGFRGHVAAEPETGLITDCEMTMAAGAGSSDAENGVKMACRDRFGGTAAGAGQDTAARRRRQPLAAGTGYRPGRGAGAGRQELEQGAELEQGEGLEVYGDSAYGSGEARAAYRDAGHDTVIKPKPLQPAVPGGFTLDDFAISEDQGTVTCPAGVTRPMSPARTVTFGAACAGCPLRERCTTARDGRSMTIHPHEGLLRAARAQSRTRSSNGLPHPVDDRAGHLLDRHPERPPGQTALHRHSQERRLAAQPVCRDQPAHPAAARADPLRRRLGPGLTGQHPLPLPAGLLHGLRSLAQATAKDRRGGQLGIPGARGRQPATGPSRRIKVVQRRPRTGPGIRPRPLLARPASPGMVSAV